MSNQFTYTGSVSVNAAVVKWTFFDPATADLAEFEINPTEPFTPGHERRLTPTRRYPGGLTTVWGNATNAQEISFSGAIFTETMYDLLVEWFNKEDPIELTDDLNRTYTIVISKFEPKRVHKPQFPWFHTYSVTATIVDTL